MRGEGLPVHKMINGGGGHFHHLETIIILITTFKERKEFTKGNTVANTHMLPRRCVTFQFFTLCGA